MVMSFLGSAAPTAAFVAITRGQAERSCTACGRSAAEDGGPRLSCLARNTGVAGRGRKPQARRCGTVLPAVRSPSRRPGRVLVRWEGRQGDRPPRDAPCPWSSRCERRQGHEPLHVLRGKPLAYRCPERFDAQLAKILVQIVEPGRQAEHVD